jgi:hypothetical protein
VTGSKIKKPCKGASGHKKNLELYLICDITNTFHEATDPTAEGLKYHSFSLCF